MPIDVWMPFILSSWFIKFSFTNLPWLQVSSIAEVMISLLDSLYWALAGTTHMLRTWPVPIAIHWILLMLPHLLLIVYDVLSSLLAELSPLFFTFEPWRSIWCLSTHISCRFFELDNCSSIWLRYFLEHP